MATILSRWLQQTLEELEKEMERKIFFKAAVNGKVIASISGCLNGEAVAVDGLAVHPYFQKTVVGRRLLAEIEGAFRGEKEFQIFVGDKSERLLNDLAESGYQKFKTEAFTPKITWVYLRKERK